MCMQMRGVEKQNSLATTSTMLGKFRESVRTRNEFMSLILCGMLLREIFPLCKS